MDNKGEGTIRGGGVHTGKAVNGDVVVVEATQVCQEGWIEMTKEMNDF